MDPALDGAPHYDHVVVGGGSAGCILASRLSADPSVRVLLLEAGGRGRNPLLKIPFGAARVWNAPRYNWSYRSEPQRHVDGRVLFHPHGKVLGGSGSINMAAFVRGNRADYDGWAAQGLADWSYDRVLPVFRRMESFAGGADDWRGGSGPIRVGAPDRGPLEKLADALVEAGAANGYPARPDYNGAEQRGIARMQFAAAQGRRSDASAAYLRPALGRPNLDVRTHAEATRILFDGRRAAGVAFVRRGRRGAAAARRGVVLSCGAYNSPKLLMLSGIGPAAHLREVGVPVLEDRAGVGANLQDHPCVPTEYRSRERLAFRADLRFDRLLLNVARAQLFRSGPAAIPMGLAAGFLDSRAGFDAPDLQIPLRYWSSRAAPWAPLVRPPAPDAIGFMVVHLQPESRGTVRLRSADPADAPRIDDDFLSTPADRAALRAGLGIARRLAAHPALAAFVEEETLPGAAVRADEEVDAYARARLGTMFHPVGTCRMGADPDSVVDEELRVRRFEGLRVADASVMPRITRGNTNAPTMMIAERAADMIAAAGAG